MATARSKICSEDFKEEVEPILKEMLHSKDRYIARCAVICVEHLCVSIECRDGCQAYVDDLFQVCVNFGIFCKARQRKNDAKRCKKGIEST